LIVPVTVRDPVSITETVSSAQFATKALRVDESISMPSGALPTGMVALIAPVVMSTIDTEFRL
jgi:hypothetical protein